MMLAKYISLIDLLLHKKLIGPYDCIGTISTRVGTILAASDRFIFVVHGKVARVAAAAASDSPLCYLRNLTLFKIL